MTTGASSLRVVVLAAGQGKRMKSAKPKVLHEVLGKTILGRILDAGRAINPEVIHVVTGHGASQVQAFVESQVSDVPLKTHLQEPQLGTGHALQQVVPDFAGFKGTLLVTVGDAPLLTGETLKQLVDTHKSEKAVVSLLTTVVDDPKKYGRIVRDAAGKVLRVVEDKDASEEQRKIHEINPAIYCLEWPAIEPGLSALKNNNKQGEYYLTDLIEWASAGGHAVSAVVAPDWREVAGINSRLELAEACRLMRDRVIDKLALDSGVTVVDASGTWISPEVKIGMDSVVLPGCHLEGDITIGANCVIGPHTVMRGRVVVGDRTTVAQSLVVNSELGSDCTVGPFAHLREHTQVSSKCRIGNFVEIKKSDIASSTNVSHLSYIGDASLGSNVNIGAGTITANYDHITKRKERTTIGDNSSTGSNAVLVAPVVIGKDASVAAATVVTRDVPEGALAVGRARQENKEGWVHRKKGAAART